MFIGTATGEIEDQSGPSALAGGQKPGQLGVGRDVGSSCPRPDLTTEQRRADPADDARVINIAQTWLRPWRT
jgi:hypothetical protein